MCVLVKNFFLVLIVGIAPTWVSWRKNEKEIVKVTEVSHKILRAVLLLKDWNKEAEDHVLSIFLSCFPLFSSFFSEIWPSLLLSAFGGGWPPIVSICPSGTYTAGYLWISVQSSWKNISEPAWINCTPLVQRTVIGSGCTARPALWVVSSSQRESICYSCVGVLFWEEDP